jgi:hypothetical protein
MEIKSSENKPLLPQDEAPTITDTDTKENKYHIKEWFNKNSKLIVLSSTIVTALSTVILAWATWSYLDLTQRQLNEMQSQRELSEHHLRIANQAEMVIRTPRKIQDSKPLMVEFDIAIHGGPAKDCDIYYILFNKFSDTDFQAHIGHNYTNLIAGNTLRTIHWDLEKSPTWVKEAIKNSKDKDFGIFVSVVFVQPRILPNDALITKCETASFWWKSKSKTWDNNSLDENQTLLKIFKDKNLIPAKVKEHT